MIQKLTNNTKMKVPEQLNDTQMKVKSMNRSRTILALLVSEKHLELLKHVVKL